MRREYKFLILAILIFLGAELWVDHYMDGSPLELKLLLAVTLFLIFNVFAKQLKQSEKP
jgi:Ca2+/Na+ antiporter